MMYWLIVLVLLAGCHQGSTNQTVNITGSKVKLPEITISAAQSETQRPQTAVRSSYLTNSAMYRQSYDSGGHFGKVIQINLSHGRSNQQHFAAIENGQVMFTGLVSGAVTDLDEPSDYHPDEPHNHLGYFSITAKDAHYYSRKFKCPMPNAMFFCNGRGHAIHSCQVQDIGKLGSPASHGCIRVSPANSRRLFRWTGNDSVTVVIYRQ